MSDGGSDQSIPLPEYEVSQYFPRRPTPTAEERERLREEYGHLRAYFKLRPDRYRKLQQWLNQARVGETYDVYLTRAAKWSIVASLVGFVLGALFAVSLADGGYLSGLTSPVAASGSLVDFVRAYKVPVASVVIAVLATLLFGGGAWFAQYYYPYTVVSTRRQMIDVTLPHAIVYMYALSYGGMNLLEVLSKLAEADDAYGEVSREFDTVVRDVELFGNDLYTALRNTRNLTPSEELEQFLDDLVSVIDSGGDVTTFFENQSEVYLESAREAQEDFLETLGILSEVFIAAFVAAPLFLVVILMIISFLGGESITSLAVLIYVLLPLGMGGFVFLVSLLSQPFVQPPATLDVELEPESDVDLDALAERPEFQAYREAHRWDWLREWLDDPRRAIRLNPLLTLVATVPLALAVFLAVLFTGSADLSVEAFTTRPVPTTTTLVVVPLLVMAVPLSLFYEVKRGRETFVARRFPNTLNILSSANQMGIPLVEALDLVSRWSSGALGEEIRKVRNDITWNFDTTRSLLSLANRLAVPELTRTLKLVAEGSKSTGDLSRILHVAATDTRNRYRIARRRRNAMSSYIAVVVIGFLVYLLVIALIDSSYLAPIDQVLGEGPAQTPTGPGTPFTFSSVPVELYRMLFFHSVLIQAVGSGILAGKLANNDLLSGLKYSILLVAIALLVFSVL